MNIKRHLFEFIVDHVERWNHRPTRSEMRKMFCGMVDDVDLHLEQLEREGLLVLGKDDDAIGLGSTFPHVRRITLSGAVPAPDATSLGTAASIVLDLSGAGVSADGELFAHVVADHSMKDAGVRINDVAVLKVAHPDRGEIVAVEISGRVVLRRYVILSGIPHFLAENVSQPDLIPAYDLPIRGVLWCLICTNPSGRESAMLPVTKISYAQQGGLNSGTGFLKLLNSALKEGAKISGRPARTLTPGKGVARPQRTSAPRCHADKSRHCEWPEPPSGTALNEKQGSKYAADRQHLIRDESSDREYGRGLADELTKFALLSKQQSDCKE